MLEFASHVPGWQQLSRTELQRHRCLRLNPVWWLCILGCAACIMLGHGFHGAFCQGRAVRSDEYEATRGQERRAQIRGGKDHITKILQTMFLESPLWFGP